MSATPRVLGRAFKTRYFAKQTRKAGIDDAELCRVVGELAEGKGTDLGGGVFKKRLENNKYRSILLARGDRYWVFEFLFAKKDADNITATALDGFRKLADAYAGLTAAQLARLLKEGDLKEICDEPVDD